MKSVVSTSYLCTQCKGQFPFDKVKYGTDGKNIICIECYNRSMKAQKSKQEQAAEPTKKAMGPVKVMCVSCKYRFALNVSKKLHACPFCGGKELMKDTTTADELVRQASEESPYPR